MPTLYNFQKEALAELLDDKYILVMQPGLGKTAVAVKWAEAVCKNKKLKRVLVVTTASKAHTHDWEDEADTWCQTGFRSRLRAFEVVSWHKFKDWVWSHEKELKDWVFVLDELQRTKGGTSTGMGKAFLKVTNATQNWTGYTGTPGDTWLQFYPYFQATGYIRNKTWFLRDYAIVQTFKGFPEIVKWVHEDKLQKMWEEISSAPDTSKVYAEMPKETHRTIKFDAPKGYKKAKTTRTTTDGEFLETSMALCHYLRGMCFSKEKEQWCSDFIEGLGTNCVFFFNYRETANKFMELAKKALPKDAKIWRIDGTSHDIPTKDTIGKHDLVLCQWQSGSEALNLQFMNYWCSLEPCYSYSTSLQARGRIKRLGQEKPMFFYYLHTYDTIEDDIYKCLKNKSTFSEDVWFNNNYEKEE